MVFLHFRPDSFRRFSVMVYIEGLCVEIPGSMHASASENIFVLLVGQFNFYPKIHVVAAHRSGIFEKKMDV